MYREFLKKLAVTDTRFLRDETSLKKSGHGYFFIPKTLHNNIYSSFMSAESARKKLREKLKSDPVIWGTVATELQPSDKVVRLFIYGTSEYEHECNRLLETCCRNIKQICKQQGYEFQIVCDSICGIQNEAITDHMTPEIFHQEVTEKLPLDLNFMLLFSPSCGKPSLPRHIPEKEFELIQDKVESSECKQLLSKWYVKDENSVPPKYILQPIATHLPEIISQDGSKKMAATRQWKKESESLLEELLSAAEKALSQEEANGLKLSVTHVDVVSDIVNSGQLVMKKCLWLKPNTTDIKEQELSTLTDSIRNEKLKTSITDLLKDLTTELAKQLPAGNILSYDTTKHEKGVNPANKVQMVDKMVKGVERKLKQMINEAIKKRQLYSIKSPLYDESLQHLLYCQSKYKTFQGNKDVIERMRKYVLDTSKKTCKYRIIHGAPGSGKTFVMSMIAAKASEWWTKKKRGNIPVIMRFVRLTPGSSNLLDLLQSIIDEIRTIHDREQQASPKGFKEIIAAFEQTLNSTTKTMVILIDGVDQLDPGFNLTKSKFWIPQSIRSNIRFILSTTDNEFFSILKEKLPEECFIPVISTKTDLTSILNHSLMKNKRKLTTSQQDLLMNSFNDGCVPLHLNLCISEALKWTSYMDMSNIQIKETIKDAIHSLFEELEVCHGQIFVSRALGYLTASKKGLSEAELEDILSCDNDVLNEVFVDKILAGQRFTSLLLIRLLCDMEQFTVVRELEGGMVTTWCNKVVKDIAEDRYCKDRTSLHGRLSDYFSGTMAYDHKKPFVNRNDGKESTDRYVASQPIKYGSTYNGRKLGNLPYHLIMNGNISRLKEECLLNVEFLTSKLDYSSFRSVQEDFELARRQTDDRQIDLVFEALLLSQKALEINPKLFVQQMYLRLADVKETEEFRQLCRKVNINYLCPNTNVLFKVGSPLVYDFSNSIVDVNSFDLMQNGNMAVLCCRLRHIELWNIKNYCLVKRIEGVVSNNRKDVYKYVHSVVDDTLILVQVISCDFIAMNHIGEQIYSIPVEETVSYCICGQKKDILVIFTLKMEVFLYNLQTGEKITDIEISCSPTEKNAGFARRLCYGSKNYAIALSCRSLDIWVVDIVRKTAYKSGILQPFIPPRNDKEIDKSNDNIDKDNNKIDEEEEEEEEDDDDEDEEEEEEDDDDEDEETLYYIKNVAITTDEKHIVASNKKNRNLHLIDIKTFETSKSLLGDLDIDSKAYHMSPDGKKMYYSGGKSVFVVDLETGFRQTLFRNAEYILDVQSVDMENFFTVSKLKEFDGRDFKKWSISKRSNPGEITQYLGKTVSIFHVMPNSRYALVIVETKKMKKMMVYDSMDKKIVSEANINALPQSLVFIDDVRAVMNFSGDCDVYGLHLIDLKEMKETPIQGEMYNSVPVVMVNYGKEYVTATRNGKHLKFYNMKTHKATDILKFPDTMRSYIGDYIATNANGTMMSILMQASSSYFNNLKVVVIDVETRKIIKILISGRLDSDCDSFAETMLLPNNGSFIAVAGNNENDEWIMYLWDLSQDKLRKVLVDPEYNLDRLYSTSVNYENQQAVLLDDDRILTNHQDDLLRLWATQNGSLLARIPGHRSSFPVMYHVPQSPYILTYCESENQMMRLWDKKTFEEIAAFRLDEPVDNIEWCKDGMTFLTFSSEPVVLTKWTIEGSRIPDKSLNYPPAFDEKGLVTEKNLVIKKVITDPDDLDQEEDEEDSDSDIDPEFDDEDDDDEEDDEDEDDDDE